MKIKFIVILSIISISLNLQTSALAEPRNWGDIDVDIQADFSILAFGDSGTGTPMQYQVAHVMEKVCESKANGCDIAIMLGDNFYDGPRSINDKKFKEWFERPYQNLQMKFYPALGNHAEYGGGKVSAQVAYTRRSSKWRMLDSYYQYTAGPVEFFVINTLDYVGKEDSNSALKKQRSWLREALKQSTARWKVVYGHHPMHSLTTHRARERMPVRKRLMEDGICEYADLYLSGHDHVLEYLNIDKCRNLVQLVSGAAAKKGYVNMSPRQHEFARGNINGFARVIFSENKQKVSVKFYDNSGAGLTVKTLENRQACFYENDDFEGPAHCYGEGTYDLAKNIQARFDSAMLAPGYAAVICTQENMGRPCITITENQNKFSQLHFSKKVHSLKVFRN